MTNVQKAYDAVFRDDERIRAVFVQDLNYDFNMFLGWIEHPSSDVWIIPQFADDAGWNIYSIKKEFGA